jgi:hypothetical protein
MLETGKHRHRGYQMSPNNPRQDPAVGLVMQPKTALYAAPRVESAMFHIRQSVPHQEMAPCLVMCPSLEFFGHGLF